MSTVSSGNLETDGARLGPTSRPAREDVAHADAPELIDENREVLDEGRAPDRADGPAVRQSIDQLLLPFLRPDIKANLGSRALRQYLAELAELEERDRRICREVVLGLCTERDEASVVVRQIGEVGRGVHGHSGVQA